MCCGINDCNYLMSFFEFMENMFLIRLLSICMCIIDVCKMIEYN